MDIITQAAKFSNIMELKDEHATIKNLQQSVDFLFEETRETECAIVGYGLGVENLFEEVIDGFGDVAFVALNGIYKSFRYCLFSHEEAIAKTNEVMQRICTANLAKLQADGTVKYNEAGKVVKPEGWKAPTYGDLL